MSYTQTKGSSPFTESHQPWLCKPALLHLDDAYGCLKIIKNKKLGLKQCQNLVHRTQGWMAAVTQEHEDTESVLDK